MKQGGHQDTRDPIRNRKRCKLLLFGHVTQHDTLSKVIFKVMDSAVAKGEN